LGSQSLDNSYQESFLNKIVEVNNVVSYNFITEIWVEWESIFNLSKWPSWKWRLFISRRLWPI